MLCVRRTSASTTSVASAWLSPLLELPAATKPGMRYPNTGKPAAFFSPAVKTAVTVTAGEAAMDAAGARAQIKKITLVSSIESRRGAFRRCPSGARQQALAFEQGAAPQPECATLSESYPPVQVIATRAYS